MEQTYLNVQEINNFLTEFHWKGEYERMVREENQEEKGRKLPKKRNSFILIQQASPLPIIFYFTKRTENGEG